MPCYNLHPMHFKLMVTKTMKALIGKAFQQPMNSELSENSSKLSENRQPVLNLGSQIERSKLSS